MNDSSAMNDSVERQPTGLRQSVPALLHPHPTSPCEVVHTFAATLRRPATDLLMLTFHLTGALARLHVPARLPAAHTDDLWQGTCFETFLRIPGERGYVELNLSPSTQWAVYRFDDYRSGMRPVELERPPEIHVQRRRSELSLDVRVYLTGIVRPPFADLEAAVTAVLQDHVGARTYWAMTHPAEVPDFHHPRGFVLTLPSPARHGSVNSAPTDLPEHSGQS